jgi:integrase
VGHVKGPTGSIRPRGESWEARIDWPSEGPPRRQRSRSFATFEEAQVWLLEQRLMILRGAPLAAVMTTAAMVDQYITVRATLRGHRTSTNEANRNRLETHIRKDPLGRMPIGEVRPYDVTRFTLRLFGTKKRRGGPGNLGPRTVRFVLRLIMRAFAWAVREGYLTTDPALGADLPVGGGKRSALDDDSAADYLLMSRGHWLHLAIALAILAGLRLGEIFSLRRQDCDLASGHLRVYEHEDARNERWEPKSVAGQRDVYIPSLLVDILSEAFRAQDANPLRRDPEPIEWVMLRLDGRPRARGGFGAEYPKFVRARDVPYVDFHSLRHTYATHFSAELKEDENERALERQMGHASGKFTAGTYVHPLEANQRRAAALFDRRMRLALERREALWGPGSVSNP